MSNTLMLFLSTYCSYWVSFLPIFLLPGASPATHIPSFCLLQFLQVIQKTKQNRCQLIPLRYAFFDWLLRDNPPSVQDGYLQLFNLTNHISGFLLFLCLNYNNIVPIIPHIYIQLFLVLICEYGFTLFM